MCFIARCSALRAGDGLAFLSRVVLGVYLPGMFVDGLFPGRLEKLSIYQ